MNILLVSLGIVGVGVKGGGQWDVKFNITQQ